MKRIANHVICHGRWKISQMSPSWTGNGKAGSIFLWTITRFHITRNGSTIKEVDHTEWITSTNSSYDWSYFCNNGITRNSADRKTWLGGISDVLHASWGYGRIFIFKSFFVPPASVFPFCSCINPCSFFSICSSGLLSTSRQASPCFTWFVSSSSPSLLVFYNIKCCQLIASLFLRYTDEAQGLQHCRIVKTTLCAKEGLQLLWMGAEWNLVGGEM